MDAVYLDGGALIRMISGGAANLQANAGVVNNLNVFPIPDGDTGQNMTLTILGGLRALEGRTDGPVGLIARRVADGALLSARGNSGVILSQLFAGFADGVEGLDTAGLPELAAALQCGVKAAYGAVVTPTEGTILTVAREAADYAAGRLGERSTLASFGRDYGEALYAFLQRTPELLAVLQEAGVIDSGGAGLHFIVQGALRARSGEQLELHAPETASSGETDLSKFTADSVMEFGYCTEFLLQLQTCKCDPARFSVEDLIAHLRTLGDSIVAFQTGSVVKVHVHTMTPGAVLNDCQKYGEFLTLKIENMTLQHHETVIRNDFSPEPREEKKPFAVVTVASGAGIIEALRALGADQVIDGGQTDNPSAEEFLAAFRAARAETIFVLPNNANVVLAAKQAAGLYEDGEVRVIETKTLGEGYAALSMLSYDSGDADEIERELREAARGVVTGMVARAVRDAGLNGLEIHRDGYLGFTDKEVLVSAPDRQKAAMALSRALDAAGHELLLVVFGAAVDREERAAFQRFLAESCPNTERYTLDGGQAVYDYLLILQ